LSKFETFSNLNCNINGSLNIVHHPRTQNYHHNSKSSFYIGLLLDFIDNHLEDDIFQEEISMLLGYF